MLTCDGSGAEPPVLPAETRRRRRSARSRTRPTADPLDTVARRGVRIRALFANSCRPDADGSVTDRRGAGPTSSLPISEPPPPCGSSHRFEMVFSMSNARFGYQLDDFRYRSSLRPHYRQFYIECAYSTAICVAIDSHLEHLEISHSDDLIDDHRRVRQRLNRITTGALRSGGSDGRRSNNNATSVSGVRRRRRYPGHPARPCQSKAVSRSWGTFPPPAAARSR